MWGRQRGRGAEEVLRGAGNEQGVTLVKLGGWKTMTHPDGTPFRNQGDCVSYQNTGK